MDGPRVKSSFVGFKCDSDYIVGLFLAKKPKYCAAIDCLNFNCGHFDRKYMICELMEVSGNE